MREVLLAESWIKRAISSLAHAKGIDSDDLVYYEDLCFDCQQAAEKAIKGVMILKRISPPRSHNIGYLLDGLVSSGVDVPDELFVSARLTDYAVTTRYPGTYEPVNREEYLEAYHLADSVVNWAKGILNSK
ncbi:MAG: HEPN domain-containing protein [Methanomicrobiales archaeon]|nr:HEPN domain-containing protein [Methanomicrobiales archaeon]